MIGHRAHDLAPLGRAGAPAGAGKLGIDPARLPPGQSPTSEVPRPHRRAQSRTSPWIAGLLSVHGEADDPFALRWDELMALEQVDDDLRHPLRDALVEVRHALARGPRRERCSSARSPGPARPT